MGVIESIYEKARAHNQRIAIPECDNPTMMRAAVKAHNEGIARIVFVGDKEKVKAVAEAEGIDISKIEFVDIHNEEYRNELVERYFTLPNIIMSKKSITRRMTQPLYMALVMEAVGDVDCTFAGLDATTFEVVMAATGIIGLAEGVETASCFFITELREFEGKENYFIGMSDGGVSVEPTAKQLAGIAIASCETYEAFKGEPAKCAMLSYSTLGSGAGPSVDRVAEAVKLANEMRPELWIDGEFQVDAAISARVAKKKVKRESKVAGEANVLIFPEIAACNIASKLVQLTADCNAYGPILQGFRLPVCDCSRSDTEDRILNNIACSSVLAARKKL